MRDNIKNIDHFKQLTANKKYKNINCYLTPLEIEMLAKNRELSYIETENGLFIYHNYEKVAWLYLFLVSDDPLMIKFPENNGIVVTEFLGGDYTISEKSLNVINFLKDIGFTHDDTFYKMIKKINQNDEINIPDLLDFSFSVATPDHIEQISAILSKSFDFDVVSNLLMSEKELIRQVSNGNLLCAFWDEKVIGTIIIDFTNNHPRFLAVDPCFRGKSIGKALCTAAIKCIYDKHKGKGDLQFFVWVRKENQPAISTYTKLGFGFNGRVLERYIQGNNKL